MEYPHIHKYFLQKTFPTRENWVSEYSKGSRVWVLPQGDDHWGQQSEWRQWTVQAQIICWHWCSGQLPSWQTSPRTLQHLGTMGCLRVQIAIPCQIQLLTAVAYVCLRPSRPGLVQHWPQAAVIQDLSIYHPYSSRPISPVIRAPRHHWYEWIMSCLFQPRPKHHPWTSAPSPHHQPIICSHSWIIIKLPSIS